MKMAQPRKLLAANQFIIKNGEIKLQRIKVGLQWLLELVYNLQFNFIILKFN
jgi:hypothetical protein